MHSRPITNFSSCLTRCHYRCGTSDTRQWIVARIRFPIWSSSSFCSDAAPAGTQLTSHFAPDDGKSAFAGSSTLRLFLTNALLEVCRIRPLVEFGAAVMQQAAKPSAGPLGWLMLQCARPAFAHFCGGETLQDCTKVAKHLEAGAGVRCIVDWGVEEREDADAWDYNGKRKAETIQMAAHSLGSCAAFMPLKLTALMSPSLLERMTEVLEVSTDMETSRSAVAKQLSAADGSLLEEALERLRKVCMASRDCGVPILLDAEQSNRQPAVHIVARELQSEFNVGGQVVVYDTFQMYLQASPKRLEASLDTARRHGYTFAVKLVRGAYIQQEMPLGTVHSSKHETDTAYDAAAVKLLTAIADGSGGSAGGAKFSASAPEAALIVATHNRRSLELATAEMSRMGLSRDHRNVHFAQILGMVDNLTNALGVAGYNASKLVVFGEIREVLPWLLRRVQENLDAFGAQAAELHVLRKELRRRLRTCFLS